MQNSPTQPTNFFSRLEKLPSFVWIFIFVGGIIGFVGGIILIFFLLANVEGFASVLLLVIAALLTIPFWGNPPPAKDEPGIGFFRAIGITFFAVMGMSVDQPGNILYNLPLQFFCPEGTTLNRGTIISHPLPERTDITQSFTCLSSSGQAVSQIGMSYVVAVRFFEYILIGYLLIAVGVLVGKWRRRQQLLVPSKS